MRTLFLVEYFYPFAHGGSEWSVYYLAQSLIGKGVEVFIVTPNFGSKSYEKWNNLSIRRIFFPIKLGKPKAVSPFWFTNIFFQIISLFSVMGLIIKHKIDILHVHGNYFLPAAYFAGIIFRKPVIVTVRDYQTICSYGFCLTKDRNYLKCNFQEYLQKDFPYFVNNYYKKTSWLTKILLFLSAVRARLYTYYLSFLLKRVNKIICISPKQEKIFNLNGFKNTFYIPNSFFVDKKIRKKTDNYIFYAGRLTLGKGVDLLLTSCLRILQSNRKLRLFIAGSGTLKKKISRYIKENNLEEQVKLLGQISYTKVLEYIKGAKIVVVPSVWEEPFGRVALEACFLGVPTVVTNRGGLPGIITNGKTGYVVKPEKNSLERGIMKALTNNKILRKNIKTEEKELLDKFYKKPREQYFNLYKSL